MIDSSALYIDVVFVTAVGVYYSQATKIENVNMILLY